ncbi:MAG TPA: AmmeMemoRadiSam system radical SAM enzyme [Actinobacteria bacterium]|nr:AmmeMemoRadiSam system radical SAM enzyme [Actinomycetota bacterium]
MKEAYLYSKLKNNKIRCDLCNHRCIIEDGEKGICCVRENRNGILYSLVYRKLISENIDPIEKKPLFHFQPGSNSLSIATVGCNFKCFFCQNYQISQMPSDDKNIEGRDISPGEIVDHAIENDCSSISYTYTEPTIYFEYAYDTARLASKKGLKNIFITNGFMTRECIEMIDPYLDAANIDLKSFSEDTYRDKIGGRLKPVLDNIKTMHEKKIWIEITTLIIPGFNDSLDELEKIAGFISSVDKGIPWHISAYYPQYKSDLPATGINQIEIAISIGRKAGLKYVYGGNISSGDHDNTYCPECNELLIKRQGFSVFENNIINGKCSRCGIKINGEF